MAGSVELATGYISLTVSTRGVGSDINRALMGAGRNADRAGERAGKDYKKGFNRGSSRLIDAAAFVTVGRAVNQLARKGLPDLSFGAEKVAQKATLLTGALTAVAGAGAPVIAMAGGLATALGVAGVGIGAFAALAIPAFSGVVEGATALTESTKAYKAALAAGDEKAATRALEQRKAALDALNPAQREAALATESLQKSFKEQALAFATPALKTYTQALGTLQFLIPSLVKIATPAQQALVGLFERADKAARGAGMKDFVDFMVKNVGPAITHTAELVINLGATLGNVFKAAAPAAGLALEVFNDLFKQLRDASGQKGLTKFFEQMKGPIVDVGKLVSNLVGFVGDLIKAALPLAGPVLKVFNTLVRALRDLVSGSDFKAFVSNIGGILKALTPLFDVLAKALGSVFKTLSGQVLALMPKLVPAVIAFAKALSEIIIGLSPLLPAIIDLVAALVTGLLPALYPIINTMRKLLVPVVELLAKGVRTVTPYVDKFVKALTEGGKASGFLHDRVLPAIQGIKDAFKKLWAVVGPILKDVFGALKQAFLDNLPAIKEAVRTFKDIVIGAMELVKARIEFITKVIDFIWSRWGDTILTVIKSAFKAVVNIIGGALKIIKGVIKVATSLIKGDWKGAWEGVKTIFKGVWQIIKAIVVNVFTQIRAIFGDQLTKLVTNVRDKLDAIKAKFTALKDWVVGTFKRGWAAVTGVLTDSVDSAKRKIDTLLGKIKTAFQTTKDSIKRIWDGVKAVVSTPITWIKDNVYNKPLVPIWNRVAALVGGDKLATYASGGVHGVMSGYSPGHDDRLIAVGGGEAVMRPEWTRAIGKQYIDVMNRLARTRGVEGVRSVLEGREAPPRFAGGGIVDWIKDKIGSVASGGLGKLGSWVLGGLRKAAEAILNPLKRLIAQQLNGNPVQKTVAGIANKAVNLVLVKIGKSDEVGGGQGDPGGPAIGGGRNRVSWKGGTFTERFRNTLIRAQRLAGVNIPVTQGGFSSRVVASGTSHYGDAIDTQWNAAILRGLRAARVAAWHRTPAQGFVHHIHGVPLPGAGYPGGSGIWQAQDYLRGGDGLARGGIVPVKKFDQGGYLPPHSMTLAVNGTNQYERVGGGPSVIIHGNVGWDPETAARKVAQKLADAMAMRSLAAV